MVVVLEVFGTQLPLSSVVLPSEHIEVVAGVVAGVVCAVVVDGTVVVVIGGVGTQEPPVMVDPIEQVKLVVAAVVVVVAGVVVNEVVGTLEVVADVVVLEEVVVPGWQSKMIE